MDRTVYFRTKGDIVNVLFVTSYSEPGEMLTLVFYFGVLYIIFGCFLGLDI